MQFIRFSHRPIVAALASAALAIGAFTGLAGVGPDTAEAATSTGGVNIAYYDQWSTYGNAFYPKQLDTRGIAGKLDVLNYSFANIDPTNLTCLEGVDKAASQDETNASAGDGAGDAYADYGKSYAAADSVDGVADTWNQPLVGNFNQLKKLKAKYPNLKINISIGGWTYSKYFSDVAASATSRTKFVTSCIDTFIKGNLPVANGFGGTGSAAGLFDGVDIDWEYPGSAGGHTGNHYSTADKANFTLLLAEFRKQLDAYGSANGRKMLLTAALPAGGDKIANLETSQIGSYLDYANLMTYDMNGAWAATGPTYHQSPLYASAGDPTTTKYNIDAAVTAYTNGGLAPSKMTLGYELYYRGWTGVSAGSNHGLAQSATGPAPARSLSATAGIAYYKELTGLVDNPSYTYWDDTAKASYFYNGTEFWTGLNAQSIQARADYAHCHGLGGAMMYSLLDLDTGTTLLNAINTAVKGSASSCSGSTSTPTATPTATPTPTPTATPTATPTPTPTATATGGTCAAAWSSSAIYVAGNHVSYAGHNWNAKWWTQNEVPGTTGEWGVWQDLGACG
ncbi:glycosyl hydrolase family 18 protein [Streptomyces sp. NPDC059373]